MARIRSFLWVAAVTFAMVLALAIFANALRHLSYLGSAPIGRLWFATTIFLSGGTILYSAAELVRRFCNRQPLLPRIAGVAIIYFGAATSVLVAATSMPKRSAATTIIPELALTQKQLLDRAISELNKATTREDRFLALGDAAKESFAAGNVDEARKYAEELLALLPQVERCWNYGNAVQDANVVLGRIAVRENRIEDAKRHLIEAGKSPGSPQLNSFGPNVSLAKDLLEKGEKDVVLQYFELCRNFWEMGKKPLNQWSAEVKAGKVPDFGANLFY